GPHLLRRRARRVGGVMALLFGVPVFRLAPLAPVALVLVLTSSAAASPPTDSARDVRADRLAPARHAPPKFVVGRALVKLKDVDTPTLLSDKPSDQRRLRAVLAEIHDDTGVTLSLERAMVWNWGVYRVEGAATEA